MRSRRLLSVLVALPALLLASSGPAVAMEDLSPALPVDTMAYVRFAGVDALFEELGSMPHLDPNQVLRDLYREMIEAGLAEAAEETETDPEEFLSALYSIEGVHFALFSISPDAEDVDFVGAVETSKPEVLKGLFDKLLGPHASFAGEVAGTKVHALSFEEDAPVFYVAFHENLLLVSTRPDRISGVIEGRTIPSEISLAKLPRYKGSLLRAGTDATMTAWVDAQKFLQFIESVQGRRDRKEFQDAMRIGELWRLQSASIVSGSGTTRARVTFSPGHRWLSAIRGAPVTGGLSDYVPADAIFFAVDGGSIKEKMTALRTLLEDEKAFPEADEVQSGLSQIEEGIGFGLDELAEALGSEWAVFLPREKDIPVENEDGVVVLMEIGDRDQFDALLDRFFVSPAGQSIEEDAGRLADEDFEGARLVYPDYGEDEEVPCMAIHGNVLLMSGHVQSLKAAITAKLSGANAMNAPGGSFANLSGTFTKMGAMSLDSILMEEWDFTPLLDLVPESVRLAATIDEGPGRLDIRVNQPAFGFFMFLSGGELVSDRYRRECNACQENLRSVYQAIEQYRAETGKDPASLEALSPDYLAQARLVCPLDRGRGVANSYTMAPRTSEERGDWSILAWCRHRLHKRIVLRANGDADTIRERTFVRELHYQGVKIELR